MNKPVRSRKRTVIIILSVIAVLAFVVGGWYWTGASHTFIPEDPIMITYDESVASIFGGNLCTSQAIGISPICIPITYQYKCNMVKGCSTIILCRPKHDP